MGKERGERMKARVAGVGCHALGHQCPGAGGEAGAPTTTLPTRFHGAVTLDPMRVGRDAAASPKRSSST